MKGRLEYSSNDTTFNVIGTLRTFDDAGYEVTPQTVDDRNEDPIPVAIKVVATARVLVLAASFRNADEWYFRIYFPDDDKEIKLGQRAYTVEYNARIPRAGESSILVKVEFYADFADIDDYITPVSTLPAPEAAIVESPAVYIVS